MTAHSAEAHDDLIAEELMAVLCAREVRGGERFGVGVESPIPIVGALLAKRLLAPSAILSSRGAPGGPPLVGSHEFSSLAQQGKIGLFFLSAVQIDEQANINLQYAGHGPQRRSFLGAFAAPIYYATIKRIVLFRAEHSPRVFVKQVDYITAAGRPQAGERRAGGPSKIITPLAVLRVPETGGIELESFHPGQSVETVSAATGFPLVIPSDVHETPRPTAAEMQVLRMSIYPQLGPAAVPWLARLRSSPSSSH